MLNSVIPEDEYDELADNDIKPSSLYMELNMLKIKIELTWFQNKQPSFFFYNLVNEIWGHWEIVFE